MITTRPISLLSCIAKILKCIVFMKLYEYCLQNNLLTLRNSGYKIIANSTINQLLYTSHSIYEALEKGQDISFVSLDASSAFDRVWHEEGLIHKLQQIGITGHLLDWLISYLTERKQSVKISVILKSEWIYIKSGVPQGSILGLLLFLIDDIVDNINSEILVYADDTSLLKPITNTILSTADINEDLKTLQK